MLFKLINRMRAINSLVLKYRDTEPVMELVYRDLFLRELQRVGIEDTFYPVGASGNHSMLYFIARCLRQLPVRNVVELGGGQSTLLMSRIKTALGSEFEITTIEHDLGWVRDLEPTVGHKILHAPLKRKRIGEHHIDYYDHPMIAEGAPIDFLVIDGPPAHMNGFRFNRMGSLEIIENRMKDDFIIIVDDAERKAESGLASNIRRLLRQRNHDFRETGMKAIKAQIIFCAGNLKSAAYF